MKTNVFIFHGTEGYPEENWFPWLKEKLEAKGIKVFVPQFPSPPIVPSKISEWFEVFNKYKEYINKNTIIIGHSLGGVFTLRILEQLKNTIKGAFFVGTPVGIKPIKNYYRDNSFNGFNFDWSTIKNNSKYFIVFHSDNDPYVGLENGRELAKNLGVELSFVPNAGHFNKKAGYVKFDELWSKLDPILNK
jgi:predicted alpha/beta hydrolase family esterase